MTDKVQEIEFFSFFGYRLKKDSTLKRSLEWHLASDVYEQLIFSEHSGGLLEVSLVAPVGDKNKYRVDITSGYAIADLSNTPVYSNDSEKFTETFNDLLDELLQHGHELPFTLDKELSMASDPRLGKFSAQLFLDYHEPQSTHEEEVKDLKAEIVNLQGKVREISYQIPSKSDTDQPEDVSDSQPSEDNAQGKHYLAFGSESLSPQPSEDDEKCMPKPKDNQQEEEM